jgi:hypothetical protein
MTALGVLFWWRSEAPLSRMYWRYSETISALTLFGIVTIFDIVQENVAGTSISSALLSSQLNPILP